MMSTMQLRRCQLGTVTSGLFAISSAHADFVGLHAESIATNTLQNTSLVGTTYKIYAQFDDPGDRFLNVSDADLDFHSVPLYQDFAFGTNLGPHDSGFDSLVPNLAADSYVAVNSGVPAGDGEWDDARFATGLGITGGWSVSPATDPANEPDADGRVLLMFLTFLGDNLPQVNGIITSEYRDIYYSISLAPVVLGEFSFSYEPAGGALTTVQILFPLSQPPSPGALALFGVAGLFGRRRRR